jgi:hypothetical protein
VPFSCSICEQESTRICAFCTKDSCDNHLCQRCGCCSDCCECDLPLDEATAHPQVVPLPEVEAVVTPESETGVMPESAIAPEAAPEPAAYSPATEAPPAGPLEIDEV